MSVLFRPLSCLSHCQPELVVSQGLRFSVRGGGKRELPRGQGAGGPERDEVQGAHVYYYSEMPALFVNLSWRCLKDYVSQAEEEEKERVRERKEPGHLKLKSFFFLPRNCFLFFQSQPVVIEKKDGHGLNDMEGSQRAPLRPVTPPPAPANAGGNLFQRSPLQPVPAN
jgi:hypothetical protein